MQRFEEPVQNLRGDVLTLCPMQVLVAGTNTPATIFTDAAGQTVIVSPSTDKTGVFSFYAPNGRYDIYAIVNGQRLGHKLDYLLDDPVDDNISQTAAIAAAQSTASGAQTAAAAAQADANALQLADYAALRAYTGPRKSVYVVASGLAGMFVRDDSDTTTADNGGTVIVVSNGKRWKRAYSGQISVTWFGAKCDGVTDDTAAIVAANEYLKASGGGTLYFPGWSVLSQPFYHYGVIVGGWSGAYPSPNQAKITWTSNGQGGIKVGAGISSGDVIRLSRPSSSTSCGYKVGFQSFAIDCAGKNVTAINGLDYSGIYGANNFIDINGLVINGIQGANAIGVDFGTITDSEVRGLKVQGFGTGPYAGIRLNKTDVQLYGYQAIYCINSIVVGTLTEACIQMFGGGLLACKQHHIYWESATADSKSSASIIVGAFIGETNNTAATSQGPIMGCASPSNLDVGVITFSGVSFDNWTTSANMMNIDWGGKFNFFGCNTWSPATGDKSIKFGQYCYAMMLNNKGISIDNTGAAVGKGQVQGDFSKQAVAFAPTLTANGATFNYVSNVGYYTKVGNLVTVSIRIQLAITGNTFTGQPLTISGLPFPISNNTFSHVAVPCEWFSCATAMYGMTALLAQNGSAMALYKKAAATTSSFGSQLLDTDIGAATGGGVYVSFTYEAAAGA